VACDDRIDKAQQQWRIRLRLEVKVTPKLLNTALEEVEDSRTSTNSTTTTTTTNNQQPTTNNQQPTTNNQQPTTQQPTTQQPTTNNQQPTTNNQQPTTTTTTTVPNANRFLLRGIVSFEDCFQNFLGHGKQAIREQEIVRIYALR
jgi:hypothetical protein